MNIRIILITTAFFFIKSSSFCQEKQNTPPKNKPPFKERIFISPDLGLQFGTVTIVNLSPKVGYRFTEKFAAGLGVTYIYLNDKRFKNAPYFYTYEANIYGGSIFTQYQLFEQIRLYSEYELLNLETYDSAKRVSKREYVPSLLAGGGYTSSLGGNSSFAIMVLYNLLDGPKSIYENPVIRIGFNIGF